MSEDFARMLMYLFMPLMAVPLVLLLIAMRMVSRRPTADEAGKATNVLHSETPLSLLMRFLTAIYIWIPLILAVPFFFWFIWKAISER